MNFNARLYNPALGMFLAVDPYADSFAGMSPYMGFGNNPVLLVDPDGELAFALPILFAAIKAGAIWGASMAAVSYIIDTAISGSTFKVGDFLKFTVLGGISGAATAGVGNVVSQVGVQLLGSASGIGAGLANIGFQALGTTTSSVAGNLVTGNDVFSSLNIGIGPFILPLKNGRVSLDLLSLAHNAMSLYGYTIGFFDVAKGNARVFFDKTTFGAVFQEIEGKSGYVSRVLTSKEGKAYGRAKFGISFLTSDDRLNAAAESARYFFGKSGEPIDPSNIHAQKQYAQVLDAKKGTIHHEGVHILQERFSGNRLYRFGNWSEIYPNGYFSYPWEIQAYERTFWMFQRRYK